MPKWNLNELEISHGSHNTLRAMEGLRGVAVFLVFLVHYCALFNPFLSLEESRVSEFVDRFGHLGVDLFFVLSGYLIYGTIISKNSFDVIRYTQRRAERIYPAFLAVFVTYIALSFIFPNESKLPGGLVDTTIYLLQNLLFLPGLFDITPLITVAWSLSYEVFYYAVIPCIIFLLKLKRWSSKVRSCFWVAIAISGFVLFELVGGHVRLLMFVSGILLYEMHANLKLKLRHGGSLFLISALALFGLREHLMLDYTIAMIAIFILFNLLCLCAFTPNTFVSRWLSYTPIRWLGNMSYSYYLLHGLALKFAFMTLGYTGLLTQQNGHLFYWLWVPLFAFTFICSFVLFIVIEKPLSLAPHSNKVRSAQQVA